ncbi:PREDICTED: protein SZT2-like [Priapulus caudatus]|uniref:Protein SZT2-like n=1 Tax=Priapulus caudatus TaxID=37621 RepID=A0ABM1E8F5_PRICU|nr:PREDICTED: protein SZT2-like [Priapulus caudatus]
MFGADDGTRNSEEYSNYLESRCSSQLSLQKRDADDEESWSLCGRPSKSSLPDDCVALCVHGVADPGPEIREELVQVLQNRLDEAVLDMVTVMFSRNPMHKLTPEDVQFIQKPGEPPSCVIQFTLLTHAIPYLQAVSHYLRQNLMQFLHTPKYVDNRPEHHFQENVTAEDRGERSVTPFTEGDVFLYNRPPASGQQGIACIGLSFVGASKKLDIHPCPKAATTWLKEASAECFDALTHSDTYIDGQLGPQFPGMHP